MSRPMGGSPGLVTFTSYQKFVVSILAFLQFTIILDFMILSPLGAILMPTMGISPKQFGFVVSAYAFSAGISGILAAGFADRFDRKKLLLFFYGGFIVGTFLCGIAPNFPFLLAARTFTGFFGGVMGSIVFAITTDLFPFEARGRVMGIVQTAFAGSQILGIPAGLFLANHWNWHAAFYMIVGVSLAVGVLIVMYLKPINAHLETKQTRSPFRHLYSTVTLPRHLQAFVAVALLSTGGFMLMPFSSAFSVHNIGIPLDKLPVVYLVTGLSAILTGPFIGRLADSIGKFPVFLFGSMMSVAMVVVYTHLGVTPIGIAVLVNVLLFVGISSRMISSQALMSAVPKPESRGAFMSVMAATQQISGGIASVIAGLIVVQLPDGSLRNFDILGFVVVGTSAITVAMMFFINRMLQTAHVIPADAIVTEFKKSS